MIAAALVERTVPSVNLSVCLSVRAWKRKWFELSTKLVETMTIGRFASTCVQKMNIRVRVRVVLTCGSAYRCNCWFVLVSTSKMCIKNSFYDFLCQKCFQMYPVSSLCNALKCWVFFCSSILIDNIQVMGCSAVYVSLAPSPIVQESYKF